MKLVALDCDTTDQKRHLPLFCSLCFSAPVHIPRSFNEHYTFYGLLVVRVQEKASSFFMYTSG